MKMYSEVAFEFEGLHYWPKAPREVAFLKEKHRHLFKVRMGVEEGAERELEYFMLRDLFIERLATEHIFVEKLNDLGQKSCETIAVLIAGTIEELFEGRDYYISILEDGENGAYISGGTD